MSIESNLKRIADALTTIAEVMSNERSGVEVGPAAGQNVPIASAIAAVSAAPEQAAVPSQPPVAPKAPAVNAAATPPPPPAAPKAESVVPPAPPAMTPMELNEALVAEAKRLGGREPIDTVMQSEPFMALGLNDLKPEQYAPLVEAVRAIQA